MSKHDLLLNLLVFGLCAFWFLGGFYTQGYIQKKLAIEAGAAEYVLDDNKIVFKYKSCGVN